MTNTCDRISHLGTCLSSQTKMTGNLKQQIHHYGEALNEA